MVIHRSYNAKEALKTRKATNCLNPIDELYLNNYGLAMYVANTFKTTSNYDREDLYSLARISLWKACQHYEEGRDAKFASYARKVITNEILMFIRKFLTERESKYNNISYDYQDDEGCTLAEIIEDKFCFEEMLAEDELKKTILQVLIKYKNIYPTLYCYCSHELTQEGIAKKMNISQSYVSRKIRAEAKELKKRLIYMGVEL